MTDSPPTTSRLLLLALALAVSMVFGLGCLAMAALVWIDLYAVYQLAMI